MLPRLPWRTLGPPPSRGRWAIIVVCLVGAGLAVVAVVIPSTWLAQAGAGITAVGTVVLASSAHAFLWGVCATLVVTAVLIAILPSSRPVPFLPTQPGAIAPISVYLDAENQATTPELVRALVNKLKLHLNAKHPGQRVDLIYYADSVRLARASQQNEKRATELTTAGNQNNPDKREKARRAKGFVDRALAYLELYRYGFRPVYVPHKPVGVATAKNIVDVELALHAYQRALLGPALQHIIIVAADGDYLPLIYQLRALGHDVQVWADQSSVRTEAFQAFNSLQKYLGIGVHTFGPIASVVGEAAVPPGTATSDPEGSLGQNPPPDRLPPVDLNVVSQLTRAIATTIDRLTAIAAAAPDQIAADRFDQLRTQCADRAGVPYTLGYRSAQNRVLEWVTHLRALGAVTGDTTSTPLTAGPDTPEQAARRLERILQAVAALAVWRACSASGQMLKLSGLWQDLRQSGLKLCGDDIASFATFVRSLKSTDTVEHMTALCRCAGSQNLLTFEDTGVTHSTNLIRVILPPTAGAG